MRTCFFFIPSFLPSLVTPRTFFFRDVSPKYSFSCLFIVKSASFTARTSQMCRVLACSSTRILTLWLLVYWEAVSRMTTMITAPITARPPVGFPQFGFFFLLSLPFCSDFMNIEAADSWVELLGFSYPYLVKTLSNVWFGGWERAEKIYFCIP